MPIKTKKGVWEFFISIIVTLISIVVVFVDEETKTINYDKMAVVLGSVIGIIMVVIFIYFLVKEVITTQKSKESIYCELVDKLSVIYINYDKYKYELKK